jgi:hypothetical protein
MNKINKKDNIKDENLFNVSQFIIILKKTLRYVQENHCPRCRRLRCYC